LQFIEVVRGGGAGTNDEGIESSAIALPVIEGKK